MEQNQAVLCTIINQIHTIESKCKELDASGKIGRRFDRLNVQWEALNLYVHNPLHEPYDDTRLDCDASIAGDKTDQLQIVEVIKPIIFHRDGDENRILQRGVVIVEGK